MVCAQKLGSKNLQICTNEGIQGCIYRRNRLGNTVRIQGEIKEYFEKSEEGKSGEILGKYSGNHHQYTPSANRHHTRICCPSLARRGRTGRQLN